MRPTPGDEPVSSVGPYRLVRRIGSGGMAEVFEAEEERLGRRVALKRLHPNVALRAGAAARFLREGRAIARVRHPHVVQVFALGEDAGTPYLAMELLEGEDLSALLERERRLGTHAALDVLLPVLAGMSAAHEAGVVHRDLKPSNVFLTRGPGGTPWPKIIDFGISKLLAGDAHSVTDSEAVVGTVAYMAPEQARAVKSASFQSDQYSLGVVLYECLTGTRPFAGQGVLETLQSIMTAPVPPPSTLQAGVPEALDEVILRAMHRDPSKRFASLPSFAAALIPFASATAQSTWQAWSEGRCAPLAGAEASETLSPRSSHGSETLAASATLALTRSAVRGRPRASRGLLVVASMLAALVSVAIVLAAARRSPAATVMIESGRLSEPMPVTSPTVFETPAPLAPMNPAAAVESTLSAPPPAPPRATATHRGARAPAAAPAPPSVAASATPPIALGENGAPILP